MGVLLVWILWWWRGQRRARLFRLVGPPWDQWWMWCAWVQAGGFEQPGKMQPSSRMMSAVRMCSGITRVLRPMSRGLPAGERTTRYTVASQDSSVAVWVLMMVSPGPLVALSVAEPSRKVPEVIDAATPSGSAPW